MKKRILVVFLVALMSQGCLPIAFVAGAATGVVVYDHRSTKTIVEDRDITFRIQHHFDNNQELHTQAHVSVTSFNHIALLLGQVLNEELRKQAEEVSRSNSKVKMVL